MLGTVARAARHRDRLPRLGAAARHARRPCASAARRLYQLFVNKWYFDELIDALVVRPFAAIGRFAKRHVRARVRRRDADRRHDGARAAGSAAVRAVQSGFVRYYAALLVLGLAGVGFYFLLQT